MRISSVILCGLMACFIAANSTSLEGSQEQSQLSGEWLESSAVRLAQGTALYRFGKDAWRTDLSLTGQRVSFDYEPNAPVDPFGFLLHRTEKSLQGQGRVRFDSDRWRFTGSGGLFTGFRDLNSAWLDEYYRQQWEGSTIPGTAYVRPDPKGYSTGLGVRYEYLPASGYVSFDVRYSHETAAPGYEAETIPGTNRFGLVQGLKELDSWTYALTLENVLTSWLRTQNQFTINSTSGRTERYAWQGSANAALGEQFALRGVVAYSQEGGQFDSWSTAMTVVYEMSPNWNLSLTGRYYTDSGQIENANLVTASAPALRTRQLLGAVRWKNDEATMGFMLGIGPYRTRYAASGIGNERFINLYTNRNWVLVQSAFSYNF